MLMWHNINQGWMKEYTSCRQRSKENSFEIRVIPEFNLLFINECYCRELIA